MKPRWVIARKEFGGIFTERTILLAVVIQVFVAGFSSFLVVGLSALVDPSAFPSTAGATIALDPDVIEDEALRALLRDSGLGTLPTENENDTWEVFRSGHVDGALFKTPPVLGSDPNITTSNLTLVLPDGNLRTTLTLVQVKEVLEKYERFLREERSERLGFEPIYVQDAAKGGSYGFVYSLLIPLLVFLPVVLAGALCADSLTEEVQRKTIPLLLASPATPADVVEGKLIANVSLAPLLSVAWFLLLALNGLTVSVVDAIAILVLSTAIAYLLAIVATVIALATRDRNKAHVLYAATMFMLLALSLALPVSPVNAVALFAAGSAGAAAWWVVGALVAAAVVCAIGLRLALRRTAEWMAAGTSV